MTQYVEIEGVTLNIGLVGVSQDDLADSASPSGEQHAQAPQPNALEEEAAAAVRPDQDGADCKALAVSPGMPSKIC